MSEAHENVIRSAGRLKPRARQDVLGVVGDHGSARHYEVLGTLVGEAVVDLAALPSRDDESAPPKAGQMVRDATLGHLKQLDKFADAFFALKQVEDDL